MFIFPLSKPWTYSPIGYVAAVIWNCAEVAGLKIPYPERVFGAAIGAKPKRKIEETGGD